MSSERSSFNPVLTLVLVAGMIFAGKLFLDFEPRIELEPVIAIMQNCTVASSNKGAAARSKYCMVELPSGDVISVSWFGQISMDYTGAVMLQKNKGKYTGKIDYKISGVVSEAHSSEEKKRHAYGLDALSTRQF